MGGRLEIRKYIPVHQPVLAAILADDGQSIVGGMERNLAIFDVTGREILRHPTSKAPVPMYRLALDSGMRYLYAATREGRIARLELVREEDALRTQSVRILYAAENDLHTMSLCGNYLAVGHLGPGLALLDTQGEVVWRMHPADGNATEGQVWSVDFDSSGDRLYVGSAGLGINALAVLEPASCEIKGHAYVSGLITHVVALPEGRGVAAVLVEDRIEHQLLLYDPKLAEVTMRRSFDRPITAIAADHKLPLLAVASGFEGDISLIDLRRGDVVAETTLKTTINALAISQGRSLIAGTQDGELVLMRYLPEGFRL